MKFCKFALLLIIFFSFSLKSQTLKENREKKKISVSLGYSGLASGGAIGAKAVSLDYSIFGNLKVGATIQYVDKSNFLNNLVYTPFSCSPFPDGECLEYQKLNPWTGKIYTNYFPFSGAFYLLASVGKLPEVTVEQVYSYNSTSLNFYVLSKENPAISYTINTKHNYYMNLGFGWRWDLDNGLLFGFDLGIAKEINKKRDIYFYADSRGLVDSSRIPSLLDILLLQKFTHDGRLDHNYGSLNIYTGISF